MLMYYLIKLLLPSMYEEGLTWINKDDNPIRKEIFTYSINPCIVNQNQSMVWTSSPSTTYVSFKLSRIHKQKTYFIKKTYLN